MERINVVIPLTTLKLLDRKVQRYKRSQFMAYAAAAMLARVEKDVGEAVVYERMCVELVKGPAS